MMTTETIDRTWHRHALAALAVVSFALTITLMATMGFREPFADQWRKSHLLDGPLPGALLRPDNGHRPIVTDLVRLADLRWTGGSGELLVWTGLLAYAAAALLLVRRLWRRAPDGSSLPSLARWCGTAALALGFGFLPQACVLLHPSESIQVAGIDLGLAITLLVVTGWPNGQRGVLLALGCATVATFCCGAGFAVFVPLILGLVLQRRTPLALCAVIGTAVTVLAAYLWLLPGAAALPGLHDMHLTAVMSDVPRWLAAPFVHGWFGLADPQFEGGIAAAVADRGPHGAPMVYLAQLLGTLFGAAAMIHFAATILGMVGIVHWGFLGRSVWRTRGRTPNAAVVVQRTGFLLSSFALAVAGLVAVARTDSFLRDPLQLYAGRYLVWSVSFWVGLALGSIAAVPDPRRLQRIALLLLGASVFLWPVQRAWLSWCGVARNRTERTALAARLGIDDPATAPLPQDAPRETFAASLAALQREHLQMFAEPQQVPIGGHLVFRAEDPPAVLPIFPLDARVAPREAARIAAGGTPCAFAACELPKSLLGEPGREWPVVDADGCVVGRLRADEPHVWLRALPLPLPLVSHRANLYVARTEPGAVWVVTANAPHRALAIVQPRL